MTSLYRWFLFSFVMIVYTCSYPTIVKSQNPQTHLYKVVDGDSLYLDFYPSTSPSASKPAPLFVWMHGGGFSGGRRDHPHEVEFFNRASQYGFAVASISYRLLRKGEPTGFSCDCPAEDKMYTFQQAAIDYLDAVNYLVQRADQFSVDTSVIIAGGSSAGAEGTLNAVFMREYFVEDVKKYEEIDFDGLFSLAGAVVDARYITEQNAIPTVLYHGKADKLVPYAAAPHHYCQPDQPGYLFLDGSSVIVDKLTDLGVSYYFHEVEEGGHELAGMPLEDLSLIFSFFKNTVLYKNTIQTKITK